MTAEPHSVYYLCGLGDTIYTSGTTNFDIQIPIDYAPNVTFSYQKPADLNLSNFLGKSGLNITYNISDGDSTDINASRIFLFYKSNSSLSDVDFYQNGSAHIGYFRKSDYTNVTHEFTWNLFDNELLMGTYNFGEVTMENTSHVRGTIAGNNQELSVELINVTNATYGWFEIMLNRSAGNNGARVYICNESYAFFNQTSGNSNCFNFFTISNFTYTHTHSIYSSHLVIPFTINETTSMIGTIKVTSKMDFIIRGSPSTTYDYFYITNGSRANAAKTSINTGNTWTEQTYTIDSHLHQYDLNSTAGSIASVWYYACANDTAVPDNINCSTARQDLFELAGLNPTSPFVYSPIEQNYEQNTSVEINYTQSFSPNGYDIAFYNITLFNTTESYIKNIITNNSLYLNYTWNASVDNGEYLVRVEVCDILEQCSVGFSANFTVTAREIDSTPPEFTNCRNFSQQANLSFSQTITATDAGSGISQYYLNQTTQFNVSLHTSGAMYNTSWLREVQIYHVNMSVNDTVGNMNNCVFWINITEVVPFVSQEIRCPENIFGYFNKYLPNIRRCVA